MVILARDGPELVSLGNKSMSVLHRLVILRLGAAIVALPSGGDRDAGSVGRVSSDVSQHHF